MGAGHETHAAVGLGDRAEGEPGANLGVAVQAPIAQVLMPRDEAFGVGLLEEEGRPPDQDVGPEDRLDRIEDRRMGDDLVGEAEDDVGIVELVLVAQLAAARLLLQVLQLPPVGGGLLAAQNVQGKEIAVPGIAFGDVGGARLLRSG